MYSGAQKGRNDFVSKITNKVVSSFLGTTVITIRILISTVSAIRSVMNGDVFLWKTSVSITSKCYVKFVTLIWNMKKWGKKLIFFFEKKKKIGRNGAENEGLNGNLNICTYRVPNHKPVLLIWHLWGQKVIYFEVWDHFLKLDFSTIQMQLFVWL